MAGKKRDFACVTDLDSLVSLDCYFDLLGNLIIVLDKKAKILLFNSGAEEILGYKAEEVLGKNWFNIFIDEDIKKEVKNVFNSMISGKKEFIEEYNNEVIKKGGKKVALKWHSSAIKDEKGKTEGLIASAVDVTDLTKTEQDLEEKITQFEKINQLMVGRELKMIEQKEEIVKLKKALKKHEKKK